VHHGTFCIIWGKHEALTRFLNAGKQVGIVATQLPDQTRDEKRPLLEGGARANVAKQNVSHILALQQHTPLPLADSSVFVALRQPDVGIANVANLIDMPGASNAQQLPSAHVPITSNATSSFSYFANCGLANQVGGQVRSQPTGLVAIMHATTNTSRVEMEEEEPEKQEPCSANDVNVRTSVDFARALANKIRLAIDDDFMAALQIYTFELELDLYDSQEQFNRLATNYATHDQIWEAKETRKIDKINLQSDVMQVDHMSLDVDCNTSALDPDPLPHCRNSIHIQRLPPIKDFKIGGSWGIRLLTSTPFSTLKKSLTTKTKKVNHLGDHPAVCAAVKGKRVMKRMFGMAQVIWATLMLALFDAAGVLVPTPRPPKVFRFGRAARHVIFFASLMMALLLSHSLIIEQSAFMAIIAIESATTWVNPLQIAHRAMSIHSAGERSITQVMDHACKAVFVKSRFEYKRACIMPSPASGPVPLLSMTKTSMMAKINDQNRSETLFMCMHMKFDDHGPSRIVILDSGCNNIMMPLDGEINAKVVDFDRDGGITGEGVQQSFSTEASGALGSTVPNTAPDWSHFKFDMLADGVQFFPATTSVMSETLFD